MEDEQRRKSVKLLQEEEEEDHVINESYQRLGYMFENCQEYDQSMCRLIEEHKGTLEVLCMGKREFQDRFEKIL